MRLTVRSRIGGLEDARLGSGTGTLEPCRVLAGERIAVVATPGRLILNGSLLDAKSGRVRAEAKVEGLPDSLHSLVDHFAAQLE